MTAKKKVLKFFIVLILAIFLLSTGLISVLYLGGANNTSGTGDILSGDVAMESGSIETGIIETGMVDTGVKKTGTVTTNIVDIGTVSPIISSTGTK